MADAIVIFEITAKLDPKALKMAALK